MGTKFFGASIVKFNELRYFIGIKSLDETSGFRYNQELLEITLPQGGNLTTLYQECLYGARLPMPLLVVPEGVTVLGNHAIGRNNCYIENVELPSTLIRFDGYIFYQMPSLQTVIIHAATPPTVANTTLSGIPSRVQFYVPDEAMSAYTSNSSWSAYSSRIHPISEHTES